MTQRARGWPELVGGNGREAHLPQKLLALALGWPMEVVVKTEKERGSGYPNHYKIDVANVALKIGIELDGQSHNSEKARERDKKKDALLITKGWRMLRFKNKEVLNNTQRVLNQIRALVQSST